MNDPEIDYRLAVDRQIVAFILERLGEREKALGDLANRRLAEAIPAIEMQQHAAIQIVARYPLHGMPHFEYEAFQELLRGLEAKRRIVGYHDDAHECPYGPNVFDGDCPTLRLLASEWSTHPEYRSEWAA